MSTQAAQMMSLPCLQEMKQELGTLLEYATADEAVERLGGNNVKYAFARGRTFATEHILAIVEEKLEAARVLELNKKREPK